MAELGHGAVTRRERAQQRQRGACTYAVPLSDTFEGLLPFGREFLHDEACPCWRPIERRGATELMNEMNARQPASVRSITLLEKRSWNTEGVVRARSSRPSRAGTSARDRARQV